MNKNNLEMIASILGGAGMIWYAANAGKSPMGSSSSMSLHFAIASEILNRTSGNPQMAIVVAQQEYGSSPENLNNIKMAIYETAKRGAANKMFDQQAPVIQRPVRNPALDRANNMRLNPWVRPQEAPRQNMQRYKIFWDCVTRNSEPEHNNIITTDGGSYGQLLHHQFMCNHNDGDNIWTNCVTAAQMGVTIELGIVNFAEMMENANQNITGYECVLAAMPIDDRGHVLPPDRGMALSKHVVVAAYADATTALRNWNKAAPVIMMACAGGDVLDFDDYMRT